MLGVAPPEGYESLATVALKVGDHLLRLVAVLADEHVDVIGHDRAGPAGVAVPRDRVREGGGDLVNLGVIELQQGVLETFLRPLIELPDFPRGGLDPLSPVVKRSQLRDQIAGDGFGGAPPRIIGEPPSVRRPDQVMGDDYFAVP